MRFAALSMAPSLALRWPLTGRQFSYGTAMPAMSRATPTFPDREIGFFFPRALVDRCLPTFGPPRTLEFNGL